MDALGEAAGRAGQELFDERQLVEGVAHKVCVDLTVALAVELGIAPKS